MSIQQQMKHQYPIGIFTTRDQYCGKRFQAMTSKRNGNKVVKFDSNVKDCSNIYS